MSSYIHCIHVCLAEWGSILANVVSALKFFSSFQCWRKPIISKIHAPELKIKFHWLGIMHLLHFFSIEMSVLLKNTTHKICKNYTWDPEWFIFHNFTREFVDNVISVISFWNLNFLSLMSLCLLYIIKRTLHSLKIWILFSCAKNNTLLTHCTCLKKYCLATWK